MNSAARPMRDAFLEALLKGMGQDETVFLLSPQLSQRSTLLNSNLTAKKPHPEGLAATGRRSPVASAMNALQPWAEPRRSL